MSNGLGAGFGALMLVAVLSGMAGLLGLFLAGVVVSRRRTGPFPRMFRYLTVTVVFGVILVAGFAVLALYDEAVTLAAVFLGIVLVPLGAVGIYLHRMPELSRLDILATAGIAWSIPFLIGLAVTFGGLIVVTDIFDLAPAESQQLGLPWIATAVGTVVVVLGTLLLGKQVNRLLHFATAS